MQKKSVYLCKKCGNIVESLWNGKPAIMCCNEPMAEVVANTVEASKEKHIPVLVRDGNKVTVKVGGIPHPMEPKHYILFVEVISGDKVYRHDFKEGDTRAEASFLVDEGAVSLRAYCNLHGLWQAQA